VWICPDSLLQYKPSLTPNPFSKLQAADTAYFRAIQLTIHSAWLHRNQCSTKQCRHQALPHNPRNPRRCLHIKKPTRLPTTPLTTHPPTSLTPTPRKSRRSANPFSACESTTSPPTAPSPSCASSTPTTPSKMPSTRCSRTSTKTCPSHAYRPCAP